MKRGREDFVKLSSPASIVGHRQAVSAAVVQSQGGVGSVVYVEVAGHGELLVFVIRINSIVSKSV